VYCAGIVRLRAHLGPKQADDVSVAGACPRLQP
jgi:hypothetical protein